MQNLDTSFYGQQEGERILYTIRNHPVTMMISLTKLYLGALAIWLAGIIIGSQLPIPINTSLIGFLMAAALATLGTLALKKMEKSDISYITDRRVIRFHAHNPFSTSTRSLSWDQTVKVKTFSPNVIYKMYMIGSIIVHSRSTIANFESSVSQNVVSNDDLELENVYYYKDLGNYIDKIIYLYNRQPEDLKTLKPFVPKPKGERY